MGKPERVEYEEYLYRCYLRYMADAKQAILGVLTSEGCRDYFQQLHRPMRADEFHAHLARLGATPERREALAQLLRGGYAEARAEARSAWEKRLAHVAA